MKMRYVISTTLLMLSVLSLSVSANELLERKLSTLEILPSTEPLLNSEDVAISFIDTGTIKNKDGLIARGPHTVTFTLDESADYPLTVNETVVQPGQSFSMDVNLSKTNHRLLMPVYSAAANASGDAPYDIEIDNLNVNACYASYDEKTESCFKVDYKPVNYHCPADFNFREGTKDCRKVDIIPLNLDCPSGMNQSGDTCSQTLEGPVELTCDEDGYAVENGKCVKRTFHDTLPCPEHGELTSGGQCRVTESSHPVDTPCPETYLDTGAQCEKVTKVEPVSTAICPDNMIEYDGQCFFEDGAGSEVPHANYTRTKTMPYVFELQSRYYKVVQSNQTCPDNYPNEFGFSSDKGGVICLANSVADLAFNERANSCAEGYIEISGDSGIQCLKESSVIEKSAQCLSDQTYNSETGKCEGVDIKPYGDYCGENRTTAGQCNQYSHEPQKIYCESGLSYNAAKGSCEKVEQKSTVKSCQNGFALNSAKSKCIKTVSAKLRVSCDSGYTRSSNGQYCFKEYSQAANRYCDSGWGLSGDVCERQDSRGVDSCPSGFTKRNGSCHEVVQKSESCPSGYHNGGNGTCFRDDERAASKNCPNGYSLDGRTCRYFEQRSVKSCPSGMTLQSGQCHDINPKRTSCQSGYTDQGDGTCEKTQNKSASKVCSSGYYYNSTHDECRDFDTHSPYSRCPWSGYSYSNGSCVKETTYQPDGFCPPSHEYSGKYGTPCMGLLESEGDTFCKYQSQGYGCPAPGYAPKEEKCDAGDKLVNGQCETTTTRSPRGQCESGFSYNASENRCQRLRKKAYNYSCDSGWSLSGSKCLRTLTESASYYCEQGYKSLNQSSCYKTTPNLSVGTCASGFTLNKANGQCEKKLAEPATYSCSDGWRLDGTRCERTVSAPPESYYCEPDYTALNKSSCFQDTPSKSVGQCSAGFSLDPSTGDCERLLSKEAYAKCPTGSEWTLDGTQCHYYNERTVNIACPSSYTKAGSECRKQLIVEPILSCDEGFSLNRSNSRCERTITTPKL